MDFVKFGLCFAEDAIGSKYFVTNFVTVVNPAGILPGSITTSQWLPVISNLCPVSHEWYIEEHILSEDGRAWWGI